jgi:hypothetical protein
VHGQHARQVSAKQLLVRDLGGVRDEVLLERAHVREAGVGRLEKKEDGGA